VTADTAQLTVAPGPFEPAWESLQTWSCPDWFRDAKLGFWAHWGPQCVPMYGDWYARNMYIEGSSQYRFHCRTYGHPSEFGYKDIVRRWRAEAFDPEGLIELYKAAGARYFVSLAVHHDNFDCWASKHHPWNAARVGPQRDIVGEWCRAARAAGLRFGVTEHLERSWSWFNTNKGSDQAGPFAGVPYDGNDPRWADLYFPPHGDTGYAYPDAPPAAWMAQWYLRIADLVDSCDPDLLYTDGAVPFGEVGRKMVANYYNLNASRRGGQCEAVYTLKNLHQPHALSHGEYVAGIGVLDVERGLIPGISAEPWQTDTCIGGWYYDRQVVYKTADEVICMLVDIVSKNGNLLLNFPLRPDGALDPEARHVVDGIGAWTRVNGEGLYGTRPWRVFGEGPTQMGSGDFEEKPRAWTAEDFRFTVRGQDLFAFVMKWPQSRVACIKALGTERAERVRQVSLLGSAAPLHWARDPEGLKVTLPEGPPTQPVSALRIELA
jgi:alpha-L-fucosidase